MSKTISLLSALLCTFIWGTTFVAQDTGMDDIGPFTFNAVRFFVGFLAILPLVFLFELKKLKDELKLNIKYFFKLSFFIGSMLLWVLILSLFGASASWFGTNLPILLKTRVLSVQGAIGVAFLAFIIFTSNPFERVQIPPFDGQDLNPLLQDPGLAK